MSRYLIIVPFLDFWRTRAEKTPLALRSLAAPTPIGLSAVMYGADDNLDAQGINPLLFNATNTVPIADLIAEDAPVANAKYICKKPMQLLGVDAGTPLAWSPDGKHLAFCARNSSIFVFSVIQSETDQANPVFRPMAVLDAHIHKVAGLLFHPKLPFLLSCGYEGILVWDLTTSSLASCIVRKSLQTHRQFAPSEDSHDGQVECMCWLMQGDVLATGGKDAMLKLWLFDPEGPLSHIETITAHKAPILCLSFSPATLRLASSGRDSTIKIWDGESITADGRERRVDDSSIKVGLLQNLEGHRGDVTSLCWAKSGEVILSGARDNAIHIWSLDSGKYFRSLEGHTGDILKIILLNEEKLLISGSADGSFRLWQMQPLVPVALLGAPVSQQEQSEWKAGDQRDARAEAARTVSAEMQMGILQDIVSPSAAVATPAAIASAEAVDMLLHSTTAFVNTPLVSLDINPAMPFIAASSGDGYLRVWHIASLLNPQMVHEFTSHSDKVTAVKLIHEGRHIISSSRDFSAHIYDSGSLRRLDTIRQRGALLSLAAVPPEQNIVLVAGTDGYDICAYRLGVLTMVDNCTEPLMRFSGHSGRIVAMDVSPAGNIFVTASHDFSVLVWELPRDSDAGRGGPSKPYRPIGKLNSADAHVLSVAFNADGSQMATCSADHSVSLWKVKGKSFSLVWRLAQAHESVVTSVCFGHGLSEGLLISASWDKTIKIWEWGLTPKKSSDCVSVLRGHTAKINALSLIPGQGEYLLSAGEDCTIRLWRLSAPFEMHAMYVAPSNELGFTSLDSVASWFISGSANGLVRIWPLPFSPESLSRFFESNSPAAIGTNISS
jgi:WD40 repeat protein